MTPASCRYTPTCSEYAVQALKKHGPIKGLYLLSNGCSDAIPGAEADMIRCRKIVSQFLILLQTPFERDILPSICYICRSL